MGNILMNMNNTIRTQAIRIGIFQCALLLPLLFILAPQESSAAAISCSAGVSGCHFTPTVKDGTGRDVPDGRFTGSHQRHSGYSTSSTKREYNFACTKCHYNHGTNNAHQSGYKNITGSSLPGNAYTQGKKPAVTQSALGQTPTFGSCSNIYCHSNGRSTDNMGLRKYSSAKWGGGAETCLGCHGGRPVGNTTSYTTSVGKFALTTTHTHHLKYPAANINCNTCHNKTATSAETLKSYTAAKYHVNGVRDVEFAGIAYGSYTSYKSTEGGSNGNTKTCNNTACHGGKSRNPWSSSTVNTDNVCLHCHGQGTANGGNGVLRADKYNAAPGWAGAGISTDGNAGNSDLRVGAHYTHLSSIYMKKLKCNECHAVPNSPFDGTHMATTRYNSQTLTFAQASTATDLTHTPTFTAGTASVAATCSTTLCHTGKTNTGSSPTPSWNDTAYLTGTAANQTLTLSDCQKCHALPPNPLVAGTHLSVAAVTGFPLGTQCAANCHKNLNTAATTYGTIFVNKNEHLDGAIQGGHAYPYPGATHRGAAGTYVNGSGYTNCNGCHTTATGGTYPPSARNDATLVVCITCHKNSTNFNSTSANCSDCHGNDGTGRPALNAAIGNVFPNISGSHGKHVVDMGYACTVCHAPYGTNSTNHGSSGGVASSQTIAFVHVTSTTRQFGDFSFTKKDHTTAGKGSCANNSCHGLAEWGVDKLDCISCHSSALKIENGPLANGTNTRRAVAAELKSSGTRNHKSTSVGSDATKYDCIVCHMEGNMSNGSTTAQHKNGVLDFRDPDTGAQIKKENWGGLAYAQNLNDPGGRYKTDTLTNFTTARFERDLSKVLESDPHWLQVASIQNNLCLHCHDYNGAANSTAWTKNAAGTTIGTANQPFGNAAASTGTLYFIGNSTFVANKQAANNTIGAVMNVYSQFSSGNASYHPIRARQNNNFATGTMMKAPWGNSTKHTAAANYGATTVYGYLISCFDCHADNGAANVQDHTAVAHGNGTTGAALALRANNTASGVASASNLIICTVCHADKYTLTSQHGPGSAFQTGSSSMNATTMGTCNNCHDTKTANVGARAIAAHGYEGMEATGANFPAGRTYAFWRGGGGNALNLNPSAGQCQVSCTTNNYSPGGKY